MPTAGGGGGVLCTCGLKYTRHNGWRSKLMPLNLPYERNIKRQSRCEAILRHAHARARAVASRKKVLPLFAYRHRLVSIAAEY